MTDIHPIIRENQKEAWRIAKDLGQPNGAKQYGGDMIEFDFDSIPREDDGVYFEYPCVVASDWGGRVPRLYHRQSGSFRKLQKYNALSHYRRRVD